jgi:hypothetical protein
VDRVEQLVTRRAGRLLQGELLQDRPLVDLEPARQPEEPVRREHLADPGQDRALPLRQEKLVTLLHRPPVFVRDEQDLAAFRTQVVGPLGAGRLQRIDDGPQRNRD